MASLSKDISELSAPLKKEETPKETKSETKPAPDPIEKFGVKGSDGVILPPEDDLGGPTDRPALRESFAPHAFYLPVLCDSCRMAGNAVPATRNPEKRASEYTFSAKL